MCRNYHQIMGFNSYPRVSFVVCCANVNEDGNVLGGTGQAVKIAKSLNIPVVNIRDEDWIIDINNILKGII